MATMSSSALATVQARRFSARSQANMRKRGGAPGAGFSGGRASLYKQMYGNGARNEVKAIIHLLKINHFIYLRKSISMNNLYMHVKMEIIIQLIEFLKKMQNLILM
jgi:hypothetical protein